ncbi:MAG TPA: gluconokinase [Microbacterium sp.]|uniref:gluconokinase n=1 Tax=Microbacterium sp. TaxID=51671 RepID=UPI002CD0D1B1|nr:gluconokinase [Microbacterium sp.]HWI30440.1 gluconokinase [Microbacterium sp.]
MPAPSALVVMGVSGSGKSTIAAALARRIGGAYIDADDLHSDEARVKMAAGTPLTDADRAPWLQKVAERIDAASAEGRRVIVACSALRRAYRDALRQDAETPVFFVHLHGEPAVLAARLGVRTEHFMPATLLASQLATLEPLGDDERGMVVDIAGDPDAIVDTVATAIPA